MIWVSLVEGRREIEMNREVVRSDDRGNTGARLYGEL